MVEEKRGRGRPSRQKTDTTDLNLPEFNPGMDSDSMMKMMSEAAYKVAYKQLQDGTIAPSTLNKLLDFGTPDYELRREGLESKTALDKSKVEQIHASNEERVGHIEVMESIKGYRGNTFDEREVPNNF